MNNKKNIAIIPVDNRPVTYSLPRSIGSLHKGINMFLPPRGLLGGLKNPANSEIILEWLEKTVAENKIDFIICALDTIAYGGLIPSRRCEDAKETVLSRVKKLKKIIEHANAKIFAFSSIMRISDNNINEEEKDYWNKYGKLIFKYSSLKHKIELEPENREAVKSFEEAKNEIPAQILDDYLGTRQRNFSVNKMYLNDMEQEIFDFLIFAKDDTEPLGINIQEANALKIAIDKKNLAEKALLHTGSDEVITMLTARAIKDRFNKEISVFPVYSTPAGAKIIPCYEDMPLYKSVENHLKICNVRLAESKEVSDMILLLHTPQKFGNEQNCSRFACGNEQNCSRFAGSNDFALKEFVEPENEQAVDFCIETIKTASKPIILADVCCANGADNLLAEKMLTESINFDNLYGYAAWNTASNSIGSALSMGIAKYIAEKENAFSAEDFNKLLFVRFTDDWGYQANARQKIRAGEAGADEILLHKELIDYVEKIASKFNINPDKVMISFPWGRTFEVEINLL